MAFFSVRREVPGLGRGEIDAAALRAISCAYEYPGMRWIHSTWDQEAGVLTCVYEAATMGQVREHASRSRIPCDDIREVTLIQPEFYGEGMELPAATRG